MNIGSSIKRAPKWAWWTAAGVGLGGAAIKLYQGRDADPATDAVVGEDLSPGAANVGDYNMGVGSASPAGVIVPPVIMPQQNIDPLSGIHELQGLYIGAVGSLVEGWERVWGPVQTSQMELLATWSNPETVRGLMDAGSSAVATGVALGQAQAAPQIVVAAPAPAPAAPAPVAGPAPCPGNFPTRGADGCYRTDFPTRQADNGKSGSARRVWCEIIERHTYQGGRQVYVGTWHYHKAGAC